MSNDFTPTSWYGIADDSVNLINGVNDGSWTLNDFANLTQQEKNDMMQRNIDSLRVILNQQVVIDDSGSKTSYTTAITTAETYISNNSQESNMVQTVTEVLTAATDSVNLINAVNGGSHDVKNMTQAEINELVQRNVDHLEIILAYTNPDVAGYSSDKSSYTTAITTGKAYIAAN